MIRVAHLISTSGVYGAERWILGLLNNIKGIDAMLIVPSTSDLKILKEAESLGIRTKVLRLKHNYSIFNASKNLSSIISKEKIDVLHTHGYKSDMIGLISARSSKIKIVSTPHGWSKNAGLKVAFYESLDKQLLRFMDIVVPHTTAFKSSLKHIKKIMYINNFVDLKDIPPPKKGDLKLITYIGQLIKRKRVEDIIKALKYSKNDVHLQIMGEGPQKEEMLRLTKRLGLENRVKFLGFRKDRLDILNRSGILVLPSLQEWIPRVLMEAMAMERLVIATKIIGNKELVKDKVTGLFVPVKSPRYIAKAIDYVIDNSKDCKNIMKNARVLIKDSFSAQNAASKFKDVYEKVLLCK